MSLSIVRVESDRPTICDDSFVQLALILQRICEIEVSTDIVRLKSDRAAICGNGFLKFPLLLQGIA